MDMSDSNTSTSRMDMMIPYLHFTGGDNLFFKSWRPSSNGAIAGASIALVVLAILERLLFSIRGVLEARWRRSALAQNAGHVVEGDVLSSRKSVAKEGDVCEDDMGSTGSPIVQRRRTIPPFVFSQDAARGALYSLQALLSFALMLAVMTFQGAYIISIVIGLGLGEILFGRIASGVL
ncbi:Ctr copper transporter [Lactarius sanguifluus]|nr:Ctr copper transporter [Lactarius sanguifluus]